MNRLPACLLIALLAATPASRAQTTRPAEPAAPAARPEGVDPAVWELLTRLQAAEGRYDTLRAAITYETADRLIGETRTRTGWLAVDFANEQTDRPHRFRVHFDTLRYGEKRPVQERLDYAFDGEWYTVGKHRSRQMLKSQAPKDAQPFDLEKGYFPMPFGQDPQRVVEFFEVTTREPVRTDPNNTVYLRLVPRREYRGTMDVVRAEVWLDRQTDLPVKMVSYDSNKTRTTVTFADPQTGLTFEDEMFNPPFPPGWTRHVERLEDTAAAPQP